MAQSNDNRSPVRFLLIGLGPHAKRTYIPHLKAFESEGRATLVAAVDVQENQQSITEYQQKTCPNVELHFVPFFTTDMPAYVALKLTHLAIRLRVSFVIIATEPLAHTAYGLWALSSGLNIIMDKPISTRRDVCTSFREAHGIADDFTNLLHGYLNLQHFKKTCFLVNSHRRYHPGFQFTLQKIREIQEKTGCPVTNVNTTHCDGQWRMPTEIVDQRYHTYNMGYGKVSHSGYHFLDTVYQFVKAGISEDKRPDRIEIVSSFVQPNGFLMQLNTSDYEKLFGAEEYREACKYSDEELKELFASFGEIDASIQLTFLRESEAIALAQINLQHNGFARRHWLMPPADLYKGNGRVKHEMHEIKSGPFQTVIVNSKQANDKHDRSRPSDALLGSDNHFEIQVFRNCDMLSESAPLRTFTVGDIDRECGAKTPGLLSENVKRGILEEAIDFAEGNKDIGDLRSNFADHYIPVYIMSAIYISHIRRKTGLSPVVAVGVNYQNGTF
ncbi:hypothetical protein K469DRAFT_724959 [Zopfia rhizophila CBS 207.26]|uniref:Gfo/Idh/MocA-like oxidoreductase N-terminal domain-containing protein n=1 Tax=Zopfia rhizophila CBS 207.26 TaxID=1314779 RepID=A0A6A6DB07_9PEZI|nr:hypothetical protein K469DRAFT_724959 [Zopfia rhizophila CBS 207.26]